ncbi:MAG: transcription-repair coupling factor [Prevotella sp.]|nr:transcription-repair coupling factor [Prevotella sp.]
MNINYLREKYGASAKANALVKLLGDKRTKTVFLQGLMSSAAPMIFASVADKTDKTLLFILSDNDEAGYFFNDLKQILGEENALLLPSSYRRSVKYAQRDAANEILRTEVLSRLSAEMEKNAAEDKMARMIVTYPEALAELVVSKRNISEKTIKLKRGDNTDLTLLEHRLRDVGFHEVDYVYEPGQFAVRGSILDIYSFSHELPYRIDFFGDEIDTIRTFEVESQLSKQSIDEASIVPELALSTEKTPFLDFLPDDALIVAKDLEFVKQTIARIYDEGFAAQAMVEQLEGLPEAERQGVIDRLTRESMLINGSNFEKAINRFRTIEYGARRSGQQASISFSISPQPLFHKDFRLLKDSLTDYQLKGYEICILADSQKQQQRLAEILNADDNLNKSNIAFTPIDKTLHEGYADNDLRLCIFTDHQIFDRFHKFNLKSDVARSGKMALSMKELQEMSPGDYIVHIDHGIGKFGGLVRVPTGDSYKEMIRIVYQRGDIVDVSIHALYKVSKYRSSNAGEPPRLATLGSGAWERMKERTKKRIKDIARDLIKLYAKRRHERGFAFSADSYLQTELEASFMYEDTPDQIQATRDVKDDMERARPMDRLVCGDVGFGKTEVAIRAAFKAACDSKQVAVLVPTTVLALQHYQTFSERLKNMPVRVEYLSRARNAKKTKEILTDLAEGRIDILVGTHKLISKGTRWHDLGLLIIDEEQKFGVAVKEKLRQMKTNVDTLTMSATPIPRTLQFSLMGARDMSIMRTPPPNRYPIYTELTTFGHEVIKDAIEFEMSRDGQVFFVSNRINGLPEIERLIHKHIPDCRVVIGHGQMKPEELEKNIMGFINHEYDVLLSTTIVENGVDIPNANTIIINDAHRFGLSDLHQMRGRVGRSNKKAFCYLLAPPKSLLNIEARRRLEALENFSELGSGFNLAMQDLDIRGAGNLLGSEQSGFMEDLGYETYQKILTQAVTELKNDEFGDIFRESITSGENLSGDDFVDDCSVESDLEMYFPDTYVPGSSERMLLYRQLDNIQSDADLQEYRRKLIDRFGRVPHEGEELMQVVSLRRHGRRLGCERIILKQGNMSMQFVSNPESAYYQSDAFSRIISFVTHNVRRCNFRESKGKRFMHVANVSSAGEAVAILKEMEMISV